MPQATLCLTAQRGSSISSVTSSAFQLFCAAVSCMSHLVMCTCGSPNRQDMFAQDSIDLLKRSGIDFDRLARDGIDHADFGELLVPSGLVLNPNIQWLSFHSGYDFGYLLKLLTCVPLPEEEDKFFRKLRTWFPCIYDVKHLMTHVDSLKGGLNKLASDMRVERRGPMHQAGSDSLLTSSVFFELRRRYFGGNVNNSKYRGVLYGLGGKPA